MIDIRTSTFNLALLFGKPVLFSDEPIERKTLPDGIHAYDIRHSDDDPYTPVSIEGHVAVNRYGTVLSDKPLELQDAVLPLSESDLVADDYAYATIEEYLSGDYELTPLPEKEIRVVIVEPSKAPYETTIPNTLEAQQKQVGGYIEAVYPFDDNAVLICNEEGKILGLPWNRRVGEDVIAGTFFICGTEERNGSFSSLTPLQVDKYKKKFEAVELYRNTNTIRHRVQDDIAR